MLNGADVNQTYPDNSLEKSNVLCGSLVRGNLRNSAKFDCAPDDDYEHAVCAAFDTTDEDILL